MTKKDASRLCIISGEITNTTKEFSLVVFSVGNGFTKGSLREGAPDEVG